MAEGERQEAWTAVDSYFTELFAPSDAVMAAGLRAAQEAGLPNIQVSPVEGKLLTLLARAVGARKILELGTLGGYSTLWLARALPSDAPAGSLITLEYAPKHAEVARANFARAGLAEVIEVRVGPALESLPVLAAEGHGPFDFVFIDADKVNYPAYLEWALKLTHPGSLIVADNVVRAGKVIQAESDDANVRGVRQYNAAVAAEPRLMATAIQTVGGKGYDGMAIALVTGE